MLPSIKIFFISAEQFTSECSTCNEIKSVEQDDMLQSLLISNNYQLKIYQHNQIYSFVSLSRWLFFRLRFLDTFCI